MAYDLHLADRISRMLKDRGIDFEEKKMMGGLCYMVDGKMCLGAHTASMMVRLHPEKIPAYLKKPGARPMDFTGRPLKGFLFVDGDGYDTEDQLAYWIDEALAFNPLAKASKKRKSSGQ